MSHISFEDAWIFLGMKYTENESADYYAKLIGFFAINQAIPSHGEFISAYNKLLYLSAIKNENGKVHIMEFGNSIYRNASSKRAPDASPREIAELIRVEFKPYKLKSVCRQSPISAQEYAVVANLYKAKQPAAV